MSDQDAPYPAGCGPDCKAFKSKTRAHIVMPANWLEAAPVHPSWCECDDCQLEDEAYARNEALDEDSENRLRGMTW